MPGVADGQDRALREWLTQVMAAHGYAPGSGGCLCGWFPVPPSRPTDQAPWLEHRTDVILDVLEYRDEARDSQDAEWERLAAGLRSLDPSREQRG